MRLRIIWRTKPICVFNPKIDCSETIIFTSCHTTSRVHLLGWSDIFIALPTPVHPVTTLTAVADVCFTCHILSLTRESVAKTHRIRVFILLIFPLFTNQNGFIDNVTLSFLIKKTHVIIIIISTPSGVLVYRIIIIMSYIMRRVRVVERAQRKIKTITAADVAGKKICKHKTEGLRRAVRQKGVIFYRPLDN